MKIQDLVVVMGPKTPSADVAEALCRACGIQVFYAVKKANPAQRVESLAEEAVISAPFDQVSPQVFRLGLNVAESLLADEDLDCNLSDEREIFAHLVSWVIHRVTTESELPDGWRLLDAECTHDSYGYGPQIAAYPTGKVLAGGKAVIHFESGNRVLQIPEPYADYFVALEGFCL